MSGLPIQDISMIAKEFDIQRTALYPTCIGKAVHKGQSVYYVLVQAPRLVTFRQYIFKRSKCDENVECLSKFQPEKMFLPHITIGFSERDFFLGDDVLKTELTCNTGFDFIQSSQSIDTTLNAYSALIQLRDDSPSF